MLEEQTIAEEAAEVHTPEELLEMPDGHRFELIDGSFKERNMGARESAIATRIIRRIGNFVEKEKLGTCFATDCGYQIFPEDPKKVRYPDGSFIARERFSSDQIPPGHVRVPPDFALEVVSPNDLAEEIESKRIAFLRVGTRLWWLVYPSPRTIHVYRQLHQCTIFTDDQEIIDDEIMPGFRCPVRAFFED